MYDRRWCLRAVRQEVGVERNKAEREHRPDHQEVFQNQHHSPHATPSRLSRAKWLRGSFAAVCRSRDGPFSRAKDEVRAAFPKRERDPTSKMKPRLGFLPAGLHRSRLAPAGTSAVGSLVANEILYRRQS